MVLVDMLLLTNYKCVRISIENIYFHIEIKNNIIKNNIYTES